MARKALGRGLDALIPAGGGEGGGVITCGIEELKPTALQPRRHFSDQTLKELADSIRAQGILQPLLVRPRAGGGYELIAGERRLRAARLAGLTRVPVVVRSADDKTALELSLVENIQREDLDALEEAEAYRRLMTEFDYTQDELSRRVGKDRATVANTLRLLNLPEKIKDDLQQGRITAGHARALLMAGSEALMQAIRDAVVKDGISVREAEARARGERTGLKKPRAAGKTRPAAGEGVHLRDLEEELIRTLGTRVRIIGKDKGGRIEIQFYTAEDLDRIYRRILGG